MQKPFVGSGRGILAVAGAEDPETLPGVVLDLEVVSDRDQRTATKPRDTGNVINLMDALRKSLDNVGNAVPAPKVKPAKKSKATGQREMLMSISGKGEGKPKAAAKETKRASRPRKAG